MTRKVLFPMVLLFLSGWSHPALADSVTFTLSNPVQTGAQGSVFTYQATVFAPTTNTANEYLNAVSETTSGLLSVDDSSFYLDFPSFLTPGQSFTGNIFTSTAGAGTAGTTTTGTILLQGGPGVNDFTSLASTNFSAEVTEVATTPEPSSLMLLATGVTGSLGMLWRRRGHARGRS